MVAARLLPDWRLFAPEPVDFDIDVWVRPRFVNEAESALPRLLGGQRRGGLRFPLFNPDSRVDKTVYDLARQLLSDDAERSAGALRALSAAACHNSPNADAVQFALFRRTASESEMIYCSRWLPCAAAGL